jgi:hypothetical protein
MAGRGAKQAIRAALFRLGLQTGTRQVVRALAAAGVCVSAELVRLVKLELLREPPRPRPANPGVKGGAKWRTAATRRPPRRGS